MAVTNGQILEAIDNWRKEIDLIARRQQTTIVRQELPPEPPKPYAVELEVIDEISYIVSTQRLCEGMSFRLPVINRKVTKYYRNWFGRKLSYDTWETIDPVMSIRVRIVR